MGQGQIPGGQTAGQMRALAAPTEATVSVNQTQDVVLVANVLRRNAIVQNRGPDPVQIYLTTGIGFGGGGLLLQVGETWEAFQDGVGVYQGIVYGITDAGDAATVSVTEET